MASAEDRLRDLKVTISHKESERQRALIIKDEAEKKIQSIQQRMREEFGVTSVAELQALIETTQQELDQEISSIEKALEGA